MTRNSRPSRFRAIKVAIFINVSVPSVLSLILIFDLCCYRAHCLQRWLQESLTIHCALHHLGCSTRGHEPHIRHTHKTENGLQIRIDKVERAGGSARRIDSTTARENRSPHGVEQSQR